MKKEYRKPLAKFHELKCNSVMAGSDEQPVKLFYEDAEEWSDG